jgi:hypothetical protein
MKLDSQKPKVSAKLRLHPLQWGFETDLSPSKPEYKADTWVQLQELPSPYCQDEALLLCQESEDVWVAWIPEHGEAVLHTSQFHLATDW